MVKAVVLNSSPSMEKGNTALILNPFIEGLKEEGAEVELFYTTKLRINPCIDDRSCWTKTPGKCIHDDDMKQILPKMQQADIIVFAAPVYVDGMPGPMKNLVDRLLPLLEPFFD
jgi:multimeric flavodoxin WrbA